jgi:magnesium transporter
VGGEELLELPGPKWIDLEKPDAETLARLATRYHLHRLAVEDCLHLDQRPKLEEYPEHQFIVLQGFSCEGDELCDLSLHEMHFFLAKDWMISVHELPFSGIDRVRNRLINDPAATINRGVDYVTYLIADELVDQNFPLLDRYDDEIEALELDIFEGPKREQLKRAFALKRALVQMRRTLSPQRDVVGLLARRGVPHVGDRTTLYFRDVFDHLVRLHEQLEAARDLLSNAMDGYNSVVANRTGEVTKQLTIFASLFMPLSFIVGFFGQNFAELSKHEYFVAMLVMVTGLPLGMSFWFKRKEWL